MQSLKCSINLHQCHNQNDQGQPNDFERALENSQDACDRPQTKSNGSSFKQLMSR